ncbi:hypothetical protein LA6_001969 [Marinibacterium anthonyi]|nr:hypothetical protein LA6_001969 [Marinibacterium anthonyi]
MKWISVPSHSPSHADSVPLVGPEVLVAIAIGIFLLLTVIRAYGSGALSHGRRPRTALRQKATGPSLDPDHGPAPSGSPGPVPSFSGVPANYQQIQAVAGAAFRKQRLLNHGEYKLLLQIEDILPNIAPRHRLMAQTSLSEVIRPVGDGVSKEWKQAFHAINAKRLDFAIFDSAGYLACAVEYQGAGHYTDQTRTFVRDAVKREALRRAGVPLIEIEPTFTKPDIEAALRRHLPAAQKA